MGAFAAILVGAIAAQTGQSTAEPLPPVAPTQPIISTDALRSEGPVALHIVEPSLGYAWERGPGGSTHLGLTTWQLVAGPYAATGRFGQVAGWLDEYAFRVRGTVASPDVGDTRAGPLTFALQRFYPSGPLSMAPLLHLHTGLEIAIATPWLTSHGETPSSLLQVLNSVDTELARDGWSVRPLGGYLRFDFLACRNFYFEVGGAPEIFVPTQPATAKEYDLRFHGGIGMSLACSNQADSWFHHLAFAAEYRGRVRLYSDDLSTDYYHNASVAFQYAWGRSTIGGYFAADPNEIRHYMTIGLRLQVGFGKAD